LGEGGVDEPYGSTKSAAFCTEPLKRRSPQGQNSPKAVLGNPSFSAINARARPVRALPFMGLSEV